MRKIFSLKFLFKYSGFAIVSFIVIFFLNLVFIFPYTPTRLFCIQPPAKVDVIVFLSGDTIFRMNRAERLIQQGYSSQLFFPAGRQDYLFPQVQKSCVRTHIPLAWGYGALSTFEEAIQTRIYMKKNHYKSLILVTSNYHSYRAMWIFQHLMPTIKIISLPIPNENSWFNPKQASNKKSYHYRVFRLEQKKFLGYYLFYGWRIYL